MLDKTQQFAKVEAQFREVINPVASLGFIGLATGCAIFKLLWNPMPA